MQSQDLLSSFDLQDYMEKHGIPGKIELLDASTKTVVHAAVALNVSHHQIIKSILFFIDEKPILAIEAKLADTKFSPQLRRFRKAVDRKFPILQVVSQPGIFLKKGPGEYLVGYDRLLMAL